MAPLGALDLTRLLTNCLHERRHSDRDREREGRLSGGTRGREGEREREREDHIFIYGLSRSCFICM